jgi:hypothetical protein
MDPENDCMSCKIATIRSSDRNKHHHTPSTHPGHTIFIDILHPIADCGLTPNTTFPFYIILVDAFPRFSTIYGLSDKTTQSVVLSLEQYVADHRSHPCTSTATFEFADIEKICSDAGSQFTSSDFKDFCCTKHITLSLAAPKKQ